ncbi:hypothetical protein ACFQH6_02030 [Halobacteriaceae archaeon GCM10025711]
MASNSADLDELVDELHRLRRAYRAARVADELDEIEHVLVDVHDKLQSTGSD